MKPTIGSRVLARGLTWDVLECEDLGGQDRLRLRCLTDDLRGLEWDILHPQESVTPAGDAFDPTRVSPLSDWLLHHRACLLDTVPGKAELMAAAPGRLTLEPYQLVPVMRALSLPRPRLLLADGVGLGKTIQAGLIAAELIVRRRAHRILIVAPAGPLLRQWHREMLYRFGLHFAVLADSAALRDARRSLELGGNPFGATAFVLTSLDFAKQEPVLEEIERTGWDLVIIDEAHHCVGATNTTSRDDTQRRRLAEVLARQSDGLLLLTATPHDGYDPHFASLMELLDPSLTDGNGALLGQAYRRHVVRRLKSHITDPRTGLPMFRERHVVPVPVATTDPVVKSFHRALSALVVPRIEKAANRDRLGDALAFVSLLKRSVSTLAACVETLRVVADRYDVPDSAVLQRERIRALRTLRRRAIRFGVLDAQAETEAERLEAEEIAAALRTTGDTQDALRSLIALGEAAMADDPKLHALVVEIRAIRAAEPGANILIYTEYADSQVAAARTLRGARGIGGEILTIGGSDTEAARTRAAERCSDEDHLILISTDSLAEGLNLQRRCHHLIHLDLPYNPNRLEQRNGRIDRYGQTDDPQIRYLCLAGTFEERLLLRLIAKYEKARARLTVMPDTLGLSVAEDRLNTGLLTGLAEEQASLFPDTPPAVATLDVSAAAAETVAYRALLHEIDRAYEGFDGMAVRHGWFAGQGQNAEAEHMHLATQVHGVARERALAWDLNDFVAAAAGSSDLAAIDVPADWTDVLRGLPGYDPDAPVLRIARDPDRSRDDGGRSLAVLGRVHPAVRKAIGRSRQDRDSRIAVARHGSAALLLTYTMEISTQRHLAGRRTVAILLPEHGTVTVLTEPEQWLIFAAPEHRTAVREPWCRFAGWAPPRLCEATGAATAAMHRWAAAIAAEHAGMIEAEGRRLDGWIERRAGALCGPPRARTPGLFGDLASGPAWQSAVCPADRLRAFAADIANPASSRREAERVAAIYRWRMDGMSVLAELALHPVGMLMLVPDP